MLQPAAFRSKRHSTQKAKPLFNKRNGYTIVTKPPYKATLCKSILGYASFAERTVPNNHGHLCSHSLQRANAPKRSSHGYLEQFAFASLASLRGNRCCSRYIERAQVVPISTTKSLRHNRAIKASLRSSIVPTWAHRRRALLANCVGDGIRFHPSCSTAVSS